MTKAEEIATLTAAAKKLGRDSYLGPAIESLLPHLEAEMRSDFMPDLLGLIRGLEQRAVDLERHVLHLEGVERDTRDRIAAAERRLNAISGQITKAIDEARDLSAALLHVAG